MLRRLTLAVVMVVGLATVPGRGWAGVSVNIGINLPAPPVLVPVPDTPVTYAPSGPANYFFYGGQYYVFANGLWYAGPGYNGPWAAVAPGYLPPPILAVPVRYYRAPPRAWRGWHREEAPHWDARWHGKPSGHGHAPRAARHEGHHEEREHKDERR